MLPGVQVQHKVDEGALQPRPGPLQEGEAGPGDLGGPLKIQDAQVLPDIPVGLGGKVKAGGLPPGVHHRVVVAGRAQGHGLVGQVGQMEEELPHPGVLGLGLGLQIFALVIDSGDPVSQRLGLIPLAGLHQGPHLFGQGIALVAQLFQAGQELAALGLPPAKLLQGDLLAPVFQGLFHFLLVFAHKLHIQHG